MLGVVERLDSPVVREQSNGESSRKFLDGARGDQRALFVPHVAPGGIVVPVHAQP